MRKLVVILFAIICQLSCNDKEKSIIDDEYNFKKIDSENLKKLHKLKKEFQKTKLIRNDSIIELSFTKDYYIESKNKIGESFYTHYSYNKNNHLINTISTTFKDMPVGFEKWFDENGKIVKSVNHDENYRFSIYELIKQIKKSHNINLNDNTMLQGIERKFDKKLNKFVYYVRYKLSKSDLKFIILDGQSGQIIEEGMSQIII